jgi:hypothetical protein
MMPKMLIWTALALTLVGCHRKSDGPKQTADPQPAATPTPTASPRPNQTAMDDTMNPVDTPAPTTTPASGSTGTPASPAPTATPKPTPSAGPPAVRYEPWMKNLPETGMWKSDPVFADVDGDGLLDLFALPRLRVPDLGDGPRFWFNAGNGKWRQSSKGLDTGERSCGGGMQVADLNADGHLDLAVADHCQGVFAYLGNGKGKWKLVTRQLYPTDIVDREGRESMYQGAEDLAVGDVNGDGYPDIVATASDLGGIHVYAGDGSGENWTRQPSGLPQRDWSYRVELADLDLDGDLDLVASFADGLSVWHNDGAGGFTEASQGLPRPIMRGIFMGLAVGDINLDGLPDIAVGNWIDGPEVHLQQADHSWKKAPDVFPEMLGGAIGLAMGDLNGDQRLDIVVAGRLEKTGGFVRGLFALLGDGQGGFRYVRDSGLPATGMSAIAGVSITDFDRDGIADVAAGSGLMVETGQGGRTDQIIPQRLLVWRGVGPKGR